MALHSSTDVLGDIGVARFMRDYWQKRPLLLRNAVPGAEAMIDVPRLFALARRDDVESRLVRHRGRRYELEHGPFGARLRSTLPERDWTLLVQGVNLHHPAAEALLDRFSFIPRARLDDVMVSHAVPGGGVGPHFDSYDVFLLQGRGERRWQISEQSDRTLIEDAPLRILRNFRADAEWVLGPGDMLYLPPDVAHHGVAVSACTTYSIGFRAPSSAELAHGFLEHLADHLSFAGDYRDPDLRATRHPGAIDGTMLRRFGTMLRQIRWTRADEALFAGRHLTEPKANVFFDPPAQPLTRKRFARACAIRGLRLDPRTLALYRTSTLFVNGEALPGRATAAWKRLADTRRLPPGMPLDAAEVDSLHEAYVAGFVHVDAFDTEDTGGDGQ